MDKSNISMRFLSILKYRTYFQLNFFKGIFSTQFIKKNLIVQI